MRKLSEVQQDEQVLHQSDLKGLIQPTDKLPDVSTVDLGFAYVLTKNDRSYVKGTVYEAKRVDNLKKWVAIKKQPADPCGPFKYCFSWSKRYEGNDKGQTVVYLRWQDPADIQWSHTIIVRKTGSSPANVYDGEIVGYSSVRNQYGTNAGSGKSFIDRVASVNVDPEGIKDYHYRLFAVNTDGVVNSEGKTTCGTKLTWEELDYLVRLGVRPLTYDDLMEVDYKYTDKTGDTKTVKLALRPVAYDNAEFSDGDGHSITLMTESVLERIPFDGQIDMSKVEEDIRQGNNDYGLSVLGTELESRFLDRIQDDSFKNVLSKSRVKYVAMATEDRSEAYLKHIDTKVFLPSYTELFGEKQNDNNHLTTGWPHTDQPLYLMKNGTPLPREGKWFDYFKRESGAFNPFKQIIDDRTIESTEKDPSKYASYYLRSPDTFSNYPDVELIRSLGLGNKLKVTRIFAIDIQSVDPDGDVTRTPLTVVSRSCRFRNGDETGVLDTTQDPYADVDDAYLVTPTGKNYTANIAPGIAPCVVIGGPIKEDA